MKRRYVYLNISLVLGALILPCPFLKFGTYTEGTYISVPENGSVLPEYRQLVPNFQEIEDYLKSFRRNYSYFASLYELGRTTGYNKQEGLPIYNMVLSSGYAKPIMVFIGGIYASDLTSPLTLIHCLTQWATNTRILAELLPLYDYHFIPIVNPEGYEFVYQKRNSGMLLSWVKNMRRFDEGEAVNILNNFGSHFNEHRKSKEDKHYGGDQPFSEPESKIIRDYILEIREKIAGVFLLFSPKKGDAITYPFAHTLDKSDLWILHEHFASYAIRTAGTIDFSSIAGGSAAEHGGLEGGRMDDWLLETLERSVVLNIQLTFTLGFSNNRHTVKNLDTMVETILEQLIFGSFRDKYLRRYYPHPEGNRNKLYQFSWKKVLD